MRIRTFAPALILTAVFLGSFAEAHAHELLPREVVQFLKEHPTATPNELRAFAASSSPETAAKFADRTTDDIIELVRSQENVSFLDNAWDFIVMGVHHILSGPDHILFVLSLLLVFVSVFEIVRLATTFTIAHSLTIILAGSGLLTLSSGIVEPFIALSIAIMAIVTVFYGHWRIMSGQWGKVGLVFFFGLFHGLGFAGLLTDVAIPDDRFLSSLIAFNIGIEVGQLIIISLALLFIYWFRNRRWYGVFVKVFAIIISLLALFWVVERVLFTS